MSMYMKRKSMLCSKLAVFCLLGFYAASTSKFISGQVGTCDNAHRCNGNFIVVPHWDTSPTVPHPISPLSPNILTLG